MRLITQTALAVGLLLSLAGCNPSVAPPNLFNPGTMISQKQRAIQYDPYPDQDMGPRVEGGRPLDYDQQIPEVERSRFFLPSGGPVGVRNPNNWFGKRTGSPTPLPTAPAVVPGAYPQAAPPAGAMPPSAPGPW